MHLEKYARADVIGYAHVLHAKKKWEGEEGGRIILESS